jgi:outer membrane protein assembly factor BamB
VRGSVVLVVGLVGLSVVGIASAAPRVVAGWPAPAPAGSVHQGPGAGAVVIGGTIPASDRLEVAAFRPNGTLRWINTKAVYCGNCEPPVHNPAELQPNGVYGPIGLSEFWGVNRAGATVSGCDGVVDLDGACTSFPQVFQVPPGSSTPQYALVAQRGGVPIWTHFEPNLAAFDVGRVVRDQGGVVYASYVTLVDPNTPTGPASARIVALDAATGAVRWRQPDLGVRAALASGVVAGTRSETVAFAADGHELWRVPITGTVTSDPGLNRVYVDTGGFSFSPRTRRVVAMDGATGAVLWSTPLALKARLLSIDGLGRLLVSVRRNRVYGVAALGRTGNEAWRLDTATEVKGARELEGPRVRALIPGTVAISLDGGMLLRVNTLGKAPAVSAPRFSLSRRIVHPDCTVGTCDRPDRSTILTIALPRPADLTIEIVEPTGKPTQRLANQRTTVRAPAGTSYVRLLSDAALVVDGRHFVRVTWKDRGELHRRLLAVTTR